MLDLLAYAPDIFRETDKFPEMDSVTRLVAEIDLVKKLWKLDSDLYRFYKGLEEDSLGPLYWTQFAKPSSRIVDGDEEELFAVAFYFLNLRMAGTLMLYWATQTMLWSGMGYLYIAIQMEVEAIKTALGDSKVGGFSHEHLAAMMYELENNPDLTQLPPLGHREDILSPARNVCQSVEYCMQEEMLGLGPAAVAAPLGIAFDTLKPHPQYQREVSWMKDALNRLPERGLMFLKYIRD